MNRNPCLNLRPRRSGERRGRQALGWGGLAFVMFQVALLLVLMRPEIRDPEYGRRLLHLRQQLRSDPGRPLVVVLGSSRAAMAIRPSVMPAGGAQPQEPRLFNFSLLGSGPLLELLCLHRLLRHGIRPDGLLVEVWPPLLHEDDEFSAEAFRVVPTRLDWDDLSVVCRHAPAPWSVVREWLSVRLVPWYTYRLSLFTQFAPKWIPYHACQDMSWARLEEDGWLPSTSSYDRNTRQEDRVVVALETYDSSLRRLRISAGAERALDELLELAKRHDIAVTLMLLPEGSEFRRRYSPSSRAEFANLIQRITCRHGVPFIDTSDWARDEHFMDGFHLLAPGANAYSRRLHDEIIQPLVATRLGLAAEQRAEHWPSAPPRSGADWSDLGAGALR
ncbi:MAG: DUF1574 domain-containing protein [Gemmataceae bacterium]|nr:DUF1574 domain-containing protein [Gemmataceae bacterium]MDW8266043.1 hypothetical protein [Gemmataceae bacterium]